MADAAQRVQPGPCVAYCCIARAYGEIGCWEKGCRRLIGYVGTVAVEAPDSLVVASQSGQTGQYVGEDARARGFEPLVCYPSPQCHTGPVGSGRYVPERARRGAARAAPTALGDPQAVVVVGEERLGAGAERDTAHETPGGGRDLEELGAGLRPQVVSPDVPAPEGRGPGAAQSHNCSAVSTGPLVVLPDGSVITALSW